MSQPELLAAVIAVLEKAGIPYMLTGSHVSSSLGQSRSTHDIDFVIQIRVDQVEQLASAFTGEKFGFDDVAAREAITRKDMFQLKDFEGGDKVDFWIVKDEPFDQQSFNRRIRGAASGIPVYLPTVEDHILQKLRWAHDYESERQYNDALLLYELYAAKLDLRYMLRWIDALKMNSTWEKVLSEAEPL
jgi:tRNA nucleotidyltransferase/poly(A) polymerase